MRKFKHTRPWTKGASRRAVLIAPLLFAVTSARAEPAVVGTVSRFAGTPRIQKANGDTVDAARGMTISEGDKVITGSGGRLEVVAADGTAIIFGEQTTIVLTRFVLPHQARPGRGLLDLIEGILRIQLPNSWNRFEITTSTAVASVRSTDWLIESTAEKTAVFVFAGRVEVVNHAKTGAVLLDPGFGTDVGVGVLPTTPKRWGQSRIEADLARLAIH